MWPTTVENKRTGERPHSIRWRIIVVVAALSLVAAACGGGDDDRSDGAATGADDASGTTADAAVDGSDEGEDEPSSVGDDGELRTVRTSFGEVEVPVNPERIIALDAISAVNLLSVGVEPMT